MDSTMPSEGTEIIVRYGCDRCGKYFAALGDLEYVEVKFLRKDDDRIGINLDSRHELICYDCLNRTKPKYGPGGGLLH